MATSTGGLDRAGQHRGNRLHRDQQPTAVDAGTTRLNRIQRQSPPDRAGAALSTLDREKGHARLLAASWGFSGAWRSGSMVRLPWFRPIVGPMPWTRSGNLAGVPGDVVGTQVRAGR